MKSRWGFPVGNSAAPEFRKEEEKGVSLLIALAAVALMMGVVGDVIINSAVNLQLASQEKDRVQAEALAESGFRLALLTLSVDWARNLFSLQTDPTGGSLVNDTSDFAQRLNTVPAFGRRTVELLRAGNSGQDEDADPFGLGGVFGEDLAETMALFEDEFTVKIEDESAKINLNNCVLGRCEETLMQLTALFSCPAEKYFLENKGLDPETIAYRLRDFIAPSATPEKAGFAYRDEPYESMEPAYKTQPKEPFWSLDQLKLVDGWDEDLHAIFAPYLTVYPYHTKEKGTASKINLQNVSQPFLYCLGLAEKDQQCREKAVLHYHNLKKQGHPIVAGSVEEAVESLTCMSSVQDEDKGKASDYKTWFRKYSNTFRITAKGSTGEQERTLEAVVRMRSSGEGFRKAPKINRAYEIAYWKLL
ncbi:MAG: general secretion pathway protein GspK [Oligoflexales bacterium]